MTVNLSLSVLKTLPKPGHDCGFVMGSDGTEKLTLADREWVCPRCHVHHIRDYNAALNILEKGLQKQQKA